MLRNESLIILGCHRSGTSTLSALLSLCGYVVPGGEVDSSESENPAGYFENKAVVQVNNNIMKMMGVRWDSKFSLDKHVTLAHVKLVMDSVNRVVEQYFSIGGYILKDPRMSTTWPFWVGALQQVCPTALKVIIAVRAPLQVSKSLVNRHKRGSKGCHISTLDEGLHFWIIQTLASIRGGLCFDFRVADSDAFSKYPLDEMRRLKLGLSLSVEDKQMRDAVTRFKNEIFRSDLYQKSEVIEDMEKSHLMQVASSLHLRLLSAESHSDLLGILKDFPEEVVF